MLAAPPQLPPSLDELDEEDIVLRIPANYEEYLDLEGEVSYPIQFFNDEILIMGQATDTHEQFVARLIRLFGNFFEELDEGYRVLGSNVKIVIPEQKGDFNPDVTVMRGPSDYGPTPKGRTSTVRIKNPYIVVEVLSSATRDFDMGAKMLAFQRVTSLQHIVMVDQYRVHVTVCSRTQKPDQWLLTNHYALTDEIAMDDFKLTVEQIYRKIQLVKE
jgi:Uma2 family endonuclease